MIDTGNRQGSIVPEFIPGLKLAERFYWEAVRPLLDAHFPGLQYSAALVGEGSEVLGFDTPQSRDHDWGPRCQLFLIEQDLLEYGDAINQMLRHTLPHEFLGYSTHFTRTGEAKGVTWVAVAGTGQVDHRVTLHSPREFIREYLGVDPFGELDVLDWLTFSEQKLRAITSGKVFHDGLGELYAMQEKFAAYPRDVWLFLLAAQWQQIAQEEPFVGRAGDVGDELGSQLIAAKIVHSLMRLGFLMERAYAPYSKWFGTAFARLACGPHLEPLLRKVLLSTEWRERERHLTQAYRILAEMHNELGMGDALDTGVSPFFDRPYLVPHADRFVEQIRAAIEDPRLRRLPPIGSVNQFVDSVDILCSPELCRRLRRVYGDG